MSGPGWERVIFVFPVCLEARCPNRLPTTPRSTPSPPSPISSAGFWIRGTPMRPLPISRGTARGRSGRQRIRVLRRAPVCQRTPPPRPPAHRLREGRDPPLPNHAGPPRGAPFRMGLPWPARRDGGREGALGFRSSGHHRLRRRPVQRLLPPIGAALHPGVGGHRDPPGSLGGLRERLQDHGPALHGIGHVGVQDAVGQGPRL